MERGIVCILHEGQLQTKLKEGKDKILRTTYVHTLSETMGWHTAEISEEYDLSHETPFI